MTTATCGACRFAVPKPLNGTDAMECRFNPPPFVQTSAPLWCGRWQAAEASPTVADQIEAEGARIAPARNEEPAIVAKPPKGKGRGK